jgi:hypothetical protein
MPATPALRTLPASSLRPAWLAESPRPAHFRAARKDDELEDEDVFDDEDEDFEDDFEDDDDYEDDDEFFDDDDEEEDEDYLDFDEDEE